MAHDSLHSSQFDVFTCFPVKDIVYISLVMVGATGLVHNNSYNALSLYVICRSKPIVLSLHSCFSDIGLETIS